MNYMSHGKLRRRRDELYANAGHVRYPNGEGLEEHEDYCIDILYLKCRLCIMIRSESVEVLSNAESVRWLVFLSLIEVPALQVSNKATVGHSSTPCLRSTHLRLRQIRHLMLSLIVCLERMWSQGPERWERLAA